MTATALEIESRPGFKPFEKPLFRWQLREAGAVSLDRLANDPTLTLFCLDYENDRAIFVETPPDVDLTQAPFLYLAQWDAAQRLVSLPFDELIDLAGSLDAMEPPVFIYSIGRCGSTLFSNILNETPSAVCFSEPDFLNQIHEMRWLHDRSPEELTPLVRACTRLLCKPSALKQPERYALKFRNWTIHEAEICTDAVPGATNIFMYRNAENWARSYYRLLPGVGQRLAGPLFAALARQHPGVNQTLVKHQRQTAEVLAAMWLAMLRDYVRFQSQMPFVAFRFEDIVPHQDEVLRALFDTCGLPPDQIEEGKKALGRDSQEGTFLGYDQRDESRVLGPEQFEALRNVLAAQTDRDWFDPDLPATLSFANS